LQHCNIGTPSIQATEVLRRTDSSLNPYSKPQTGPPPNKRETLRRLLNGPS